MKKEAIILIASEGYKYLEITENTKIEIVNRTKKIRQSWLNKNMLSLLLINTAYH